MNKYHPVLVTRSDAGGDLYAPVQVIDNVDHESGDTPSYDYEAVKRRCDELNRLLEEREKRKLHSAAANDPDRWY